MESEVPGRALELSNDYQVIITIVLFLEASGTVPGPPYRFSEWNRTRGPVTNPHAFPANQHSESTSVGEQVVRIPQVSGNENTL